MVISVVGRLRKFLVANQPCSKYGIRMESLKIEIDGEDLARVAFAAVFPDEVGKEARLHDGELAIYASIHNETLSLNVKYKSESVLIFVGKIAGQATFAYKLDDSRKLTLDLQ
jgi:hypothetical protein